MEKDGFVAWRFLVLLRRFTVAALGLLCFLGLHLHLVIFIFSKTRRVVMGNKLGASSLMPEDGQIHKLIQGYGLAGSVKEGKKEETRRVIILVLLCRCFFG